jgi:GNAT superfamily N-acetyltransferase
MNLSVVQSNQDISDFYLVERIIYRDIPQFVPYIRQDIEKIFDTDKNKLFRQGGKAIRWILRDSSGTLCGRVAAFVHPKTWNTFKQPTGGMGFFECINNREAADILFNACRDWLKEQGMEAMDGPVNFGEKLNYWGLMVSRYDEIQTYGMYYHPPYYKSLFEAYGFQCYYEQYMFHRDLMAPAQEVFVRKAEILLQDPEISVRNVRGVSDKKFAEDFLAVYNDAWGGHEGFKLMTIEQAYKTIKAMKPIYDPDIVVFVFKKERPIGFYVNLPELNQIFKYVGGNLNLWGKLKFVWHRKIHPPHTMYGIIFGVVKDYQGKGVEGAMIKYAADTIAPMRRYKDTVLAWIGDFNPKMLKVCENLGAENFRTYITYRKLFHPDATFERAPIIGRKDTTEEKSES